jgi:hypothetical protein
VPFHWMPTNQPKNDGRPNRKLDASAQPRRLI